MSELNEWQRKDKMSANKVMEQVETHINTMGFNPAFMVERSMRFHRTLQQSFGGFVFLWIKEMANAYVEKRYDLRNEATCQRCYNIVCAMETLHGDDEVKYLEHLPHI